VRGLSARWWKRAANEEKDVLCANNTHDVEVVREPDPSLNNCQIRLPLSHQVSISRRSNGFDELDVLSVVPDSAFNQKGGFCSRNSDSHRPLLKVVSVNPPHEDGGGKDEDIEADL
jgi:hypothetical protein